MKRMNVLMIGVLGTSVLCGCSGGGFNGFGGLSDGAWGGLGGAGIGALAGQAIGHDTESTLLGTAIGGVGGYILGNEQDKYNTREDMDRLEYENYMLRQRQRWNSGDRR